MLDTAKMQGGLHYGLLPTSGEGLSHSWGTFLSPSNGDMGVVQIPQIWKSCFDVVGMLVVCVLNASRGVKTILISKTRD